MSSSGYWAVFVGPPFSAYLRSIYACKSIKRVFSLSARIRKPGRILRSSYWASTRNSSEEDELPPVFDMQSRYAREFFGVARDQGGPQAQRLGGNEGVQGANRRTCIFQNRAHSYIYLRHCVVYWKTSKGARMAESKCCSCARR